jgi:hypothetical protein
MFGLIGKKLVVVLADKENKMIGQVVSIKTNYTSSVYHFMVKDIRDQGIYGDYIVLSSTPTVFRNGLMLWKDIVSLKKLSQKHAEQFKDKM